MNQSRLFDSSSLGDLTVQALLGNPERAAVVHGDSVVSYGRLRREVAATAAALRHAGIQPGDGIAVLAPNRTEVIVTLLASYVLGLRFTPLSPLVSNSDAELMLRKARVRCLIVDPMHFPDFDWDIGHRVDGLDLLFTYGEAPSGRNLLMDMKSFANESLQSEAELDGVAALTFTGGTTGAPKAVVQLQSAGVAMYLMMLAGWEWPQEVRMLLATPLSHAAGGLVLPVLMKGGAVVLMDRFQPAACLEEMNRSRVTVTFMVPSMIYALLDCIENGAPTPDRLETIFYGAARIEKRRLLQGLQVLGPVFMQLYGQAEAPLCLTVLRRCEHDPDQPELLESCGRPMPGIRIVLLDDDGNEVATGQSGEICVRGPIVMREYLDDPEETQEAFQYGWLQTGDVGRFDEDGYLYIVDRKKDMIITGGINVYPSQIEAVLATHEDVAACAVVGIPDRRWGEAVAAVVVAEPGKSIDSDELKTHVHKVKGPVCTPKLVIETDRIPLTPIGKPDKRAVRALLELE